MQCINLTLTALDKTITFIKDNKLPTPKRMDYVTYLTGLYVYLGDQEPSDAQKSEIIEWYNKTKFTNMSNPGRRNTFDKLLDIRFTNYKMSKIASILLPKINKDTLLPSVV